MKGYFVKTWDNKLVPAAEENERDILAKIPTGQAVLVEIKTGRILGFHRKYFCMLKVAFENQDQYDNFEHFRKAVIIRSGYCETFIMNDGTIVHSADSISWAKMDQSTFEDLYSKSIDAILKYYCIGSTREIIDQKVLDILEFS